MDENKNFTKKFTKKKASFSDHGKVPPQATNLEEAVLGALMLDKDAVALIIDILRPASFYKEAHEHIYKAICILFEKSHPIDLLTVTEELKKLGKLEMVGGPYQLVELTNRVASSANIEFHARIIAQKFIQRELIRSSTETINAVKDEGNHSAHYYALNIPASWIYEDLTHKSADDTKSNQLTANVGSVVTYGDNPITLTVGTDAGNFNNVVSASAVVLKNNWFNAYVFLGAGGMIYKTYSDVLDENGNPYDYESFFREGIVNGEVNTDLLDVFADGIVSSGERGTVRDALKELYGAGTLKRSYESAAEGHSNEEQLFSRVFNPAFHVGAAVDFLVHPRISIGLETKQTFTNDDLIDGQRWSEQGDLTRDYDTYNQTTLTLALHIGKKKAKSDLPMWWENPSERTMYMLQQQPDVAKIVKEPPFSIFLAAPKKRFGLCNALASTPPVKTFPEAGITVL